MTVQPCKLGRTDLAISSLAFGAAPLGDVYGSMTDAEVQRVVHSALEAGVNLFDTAPYYGNTLSESRLGMALRGRRQQAVITTKCARFGFDDFDFSAPRVHKSIDESLSRLQTDYVDVLFAHDIEFADKRQIVDETLPALRDVQRRGKARFIGVTGLSLKMLQAVAEEFPVDVILSYCRYSLLNRDLAEELGPFCVRENVGLINASPLHMGLLAEGEPPQWHPAPEPVKRAARQVVALCLSRGVQPAAAALRFAAACPFSACTLTGISSEDQLRENISALAAGPLEAGLLAEIEALVQPVRNLIWITGKSENH